MDKLKISQSFNLQGEVCISGAKNAALPIICASILAKDGLSLTNVPELKDIYTLTTILEQMGAKVDFNNNQMTVDSSNITNYIAHYDLVKTMRASILVLGPLIARFGQARVSLPGGCAIGARPVDQHIKGLRLMGAEITIEDGYIVAQAQKLIGCKIVMDVITVTGTENLLMASTLADGTTILENCAIEPEVTDLANCLNKMGAKISGIGTSTLTIIGVKDLNLTSHSIIGDRIEAGTYLVAAAITRSSLTLTNIEADNLVSVIQILRQMGAIINTSNNQIQISMNKRPQAIDIVTNPYPSFPTDMQAQLMALTSISQGNSTFVETIFENRYMHVSELNRLGANIVVHGNTATVHGVATLTGATVMATDLRASASLVLAALIAQGETIIERIYHLDRGYEKIEKKLKNIGVKIERIS